MRTRMMINTYDKHNAADCFATGFKYKGYVYGFLCDTAFILEHAKRDKTSRKHGRKACLRLHYTAAAKRDLATDYHGNARRLCTIEEFNAMKCEGENNGHVFERLMCERYNGIAYKRGAWWETADFHADCNIRGTRNNKIILKWEEVQAKFDGGTFCTAEQCEALRK